MTRLGFATMGLLIAATFAGCCCPGYHDPYTGYVHGGGYCCRFQPFRWMREHKQRKRYKKSLRTTHPRHLNSGYHVAPGHQFQPMNSGDCPNCQPQNLPMTPMPEGEIYYEGPVQEDAHPPAMLAPPAEEQPQDPGPPGSQKIEKPVPMPPTDSSSDLRTPPIRQELAPLPLKDTRRPRFEMPVR